MLFRAADEQGQPVCIKLFRRVTKHHVTLKEEFLRELKAQKNLLHQHILPVLDFGTDYGPFGGEPFMIMPLCVGGDLRRLLGPRAFLPLDEAMPIVRRLAMAIDFAHTAGFVHGDIKPENVLFGQSKAETYLCDFGLSKYFRIEESVSSQHTMTAGGGSSAYLSPEQIGENSQSALSDIYSLGVVVYEMLTGRLPFDTNQPVLWQMMAKVSGDIVPPNEVRPTLPATACSALIAALDSIPANRPRSARDFYKQLSSKQQDSPSSVQPPASPSGPPRVFLSYTQTDGKWVERLRVHLRPLERVGLIDLWDESRIAPGSDWRTAIAAAVESAHIAVLLLSPDYLASDFLAGEQLTSLHGRSDSTAHVVDLS
jgi:serine/threonine-protein kinase